MSSDEVIVAVEVSPYPLRRQVGPSILEFIRALRKEDGVDVVTKQMSRQAKRRFSEAFAALKRSMRKILSGPDRVVFFTRTNILDLYIEHMPDLG